MRKAIIIPIGAVVALGAAYVGGLAYVKHRAVEEASNHGVTLGIGRVRFALDGIHLEDIDATSVQLTSTKVHADEIVASWNAEDVSAIGVDVSADGHITPPTAPTDNMIADGNRGPSVIHVQNAHMSWTHAFGDANVELTSLSGDFPLDPTLRNADVTWTTDVTVTYNGRKFGPFSAEFKHGHEEDVTVNLDPKAHDGAVLRIGNLASTPRIVDFTIAGRPLSEIGIPTSAFGFQIASDPKITLHLNDAVDRSPGGAPHATGSVDFSTDPIALPGLPQPGAIALSMNWSGNPDQPMPLSADPKVAGSSLRIGPFKGPVTGTVTRPDGAVVLDLAFVSQPVPCSQFSSGDPLQNMLGGSAFGSIAALAGAQSQVTGDVKLTGSVQFDSRNAGAPKISLSPVTTCGVSISLGSGGK
jgi:hypothetical protein